MKALVCTSPRRFGYIEQDEPASAPGQAILKIQRIGVCGTDLHAFEGTQPYFSYPRILGHELAGTIVDTGGADHLSIGSAATLIPYFSCGHCIACRNGKPNCCVQIKVCGVHIDGGMREYLSVPAASVIRHPGLSLDALALLEPLAIGAHGIRRAQVQPGEFVLVVGAGPIGLAAMQFAMLAGTEVIAIDLAEPRLQFARRLGINHIVNAGAANHKEQLLDITSGDMPTLVIDATGSRQAINNSLNFLAHGGRYVLIGLQQEPISFSHPEFHKREATLMSSRNATAADFSQVIAAVEKGFVDPLAYITHRARFSEVKDVFESWLSPANGVIKAMIEIE